MCFAMRRCMSYQIFDISKRAFKHTLENQCNHTNYPNHWCISYAGASLQTTNVLFICICVEKIGIYLKTGRGLFHVYICCSRIVRGNQLVNKVTNALHVSSWPLQRLLSTWWLWITDTYSNDTGTDSTLCTPKRTARFIHITLDLC